jgi:ABC-type branched-subunit amino acid transport system permease subunit
VSGTSFNYVNSLVVLAVLSIAGRTTITAAVLGPIAMVVGPSYVTSFSDGFQVIFGLGAILAAMYAVRPEIPFTRWIQRDAYRRDSTTAARAGRPPSPAGVISGTAR